MTVSIHPSAVCDSSDVGAGTQLGAGSRVERGASVGKKCVLGERAAVASRAVIGDGASIGARAQVLEGVRVGRGAQVAEGAVVAAPVPEFGIASGHPARITGFVAAGHPTTLTDAERSWRPGAPAAVRGTSIHRMQSISDPRGSLHVAEFGRHVPFDVRRCFLIRDVAEGMVRGQHAHRRCHQHLVMAAGSCTIVIDDGRARRQLIADAPTHGLHLEPLVWATMYDFSPDAALLVFASEHYDEADYLREYGAFLDAVAGGT